MVKKHSNLKFATKKAINLLFGSDLSEEQQIKILEFIKKDFENYNCCTLYAVDEEFKSLLDSENLQIGKKEIIISQNCTVRYTPDYSVAPLEI